MKKIPSYPKITTKTNITVTHTQNININSPKAANLKKGFLKKHKPSTATRNDASAPQIKHEHKTQEHQRKSSKKLIVECETDKNIKTTKSQKELAILSDKLKRLQEKIKIIKAKEKKEKHSSFSNRSLSRNRQNSNYGKRQTPSSRKELTHYQKPLRTDTTKILKKSYSDKLGVRIPQLIKNRQKKSVQEKQKIEKSNKTEAEHHEEQILHRFVTQVPNSHLDANLKQGVEESLKNRTYELSVSESEASEGQEAYYVGKAHKSLIKPALFNIRQHLFQSLQTLQFLQNIKKPSPVELSKKFINLPPSKCTCLQIYLVSQTVILDLDETLIHCNEALSIPHDIKMTIKFPTGEKIEAGVNIRPFAQEFLEELATFFQVVVFTASHECYANVVLDHLDPHNKLISQRMFREHCWQTEEGIYIKDLRVLKNRNLQNMVLVDNAAYSYFFQLENGIPIIPFYDDKKDKELLHLLAYLKQAHHMSSNSGKSLKTINSQYFQLGKYNQFEDIGALINQLYRSNPLAQH